MDAATLYMVLTLPNGEQRTSTQEFSTLRVCEAKADWLELLERRHPQPPGAVTTSHSPLLDDRRSDDDEPKTEPDGLDMRGQPGVPKAQ